MCFPTCQPDNLLLYFHHSFVLKILIGDLFVHKTQTVEIIKRLDIKYSKHNLYFLNIQLFLQIVFFSWPMLMLLKGNNVYIGNKNVEGMCCWSYRETQSYFFIVLWTIPCLGIIKFQDYFICLVSWRLSILAIWVYLYDFESSLGVSSFVVCYICRSLSFFH